MTHLGLGAHRPGRRAFISGKRKQNTLKSTAACDGQGRSLWARTVLPAHMHDQTAAKTEGIADVLTQDPGVNRAMAAVYHLNPDPEALRAIADRWRPCRTWIALRLRAWLEDVTHEIAQGKRVDLLPRSDQPESGHDPT